MRPEHLPVTRTHSSSPVVIRSVDKPCLPGAGGPGWRWGVGDPLVARGRGSPLPVGLRTRLDMAIGRFDTFPRLGSRLTAPPAGVVALHCGGGGPGAAAASAAVVKRPLAAKASRHATPRHSHSPPAPFINTNALNLFRTILVSLRRGVAERCTSA